MRISTLRIRIKGISKLKRGSKCIRKIENIERVIILQERSGPRASTEAYDIEDI